METARPTILVIEDELPIRRFLRSSLEGAGYTMAEATTGGEGLRVAASSPPDCIILDLGLPDMDGLEVARRLRSWATTPIIVLTARGHEQDKIDLLDAGADDYLTKPFGVGELMARIRAALRRGQSSAGGAVDPVFSVGRLRVDLVARQVFLGDTEVHLTPIEYRLLAVLVRHAGKVVTQRQLLNEVWGPAYADAAHYVRVYMQHLRHKLEDDPARPAYFVTEPGVGYRLRGE
jgi:two-component system KDP operon response regulator KdpE